MIRSLVFANLIEEVSCANDHCPMGAISRLRTADLSC